MAEKVKTYVAEAERDEAGWWFASVKGLDGCHSQAKSLKQLRTRLHEALALFVDDATAADLRVVPKLKGDAAALLTEYAKARKAEAEAAERLREKQRAVSQLLTERYKMSARDAGELLGLSHARVNIVAKRKLSAAKTLKRGRK